MKEEELVKAKDLEGLVAKRKDGKYTPAVRWFKVLNPQYSQKAGRQEFFETKSQADPPHLEAAGRSRR
jgi:hypothetical protein